MNSGGAKRRLKERQPSNMTILTQEDSPLTTSIDIHSLQTYNGSKYMLRAPSKNHK